MPTTPQPQSLPPHPNLERQHKRAKQLLKAARAGDADALARFRAADPRTAPPYRLHHAQRVIAREYGFTSWPELVRVIESKVPVAEHCDPRLEPLRAAVRAGDAAAVRKVLQGSAYARRHVNAPVMDMDAPPIVAARDNRGVVDVLLEFGADINARGQFWGRAAGVLEGARPEVREYLVSRGALPELDDFAAAVQAGDAERVEELFRRHPVLRDHVNRPMFPFGGRPVGKARHNLPLLDVLLRHGADINLKSDWWAGGYSILDGAGPALSRELIARGATLDIFAACELGMIDDVRRMLDADPELVHARGGDGQRPLHYAANQDIVELLLGRGAEIDARCVDHLSTAAQYAVDKNQWKTRLLLARGAAPDVFMAAALGDLDLLRQVLDRDPDAVSARVGKDGYPPVPTGAAGTIYQWGLRGASRPHDAALAFGHRDAHDLLVSRSTESDKFVMAVAAVDEAAVRAYVARHPDWFAELSHHDRRMLAHAAWLNNLPAVRLLLDIGFPVNETGGGEGTALDRAAIRGYTPIVDLLLERGADTRLKNVYGGDPMQACLWGSRNFRDPRGNYPATIQRLIRSGMKPPDAP